jgi:nucleoside-diphosphate-sugar epimerase
MTNVLLTGATGFLGQHICSTLYLEQQILLTTVYRSVKPSNSENSFMVSSLDSDTSWEEALKGQDVVIHAAARAHIMSDASLDPLTEYRRVNVDGSLNIARQAAESGVKRFIYISSIKVNGESTQPGKPHRFDDPPFPEDPYGVSKAEAESGLLKISAETGMEIVIIRPPLVYGKDVKGNFASLLKLTLKRLPLPLGCINNQRSMVYVQNLVDLIVTCIDHPKAANKVFLVSDDEDLSTSDLLQRLGQAANRPARLINVPASFLKFCARLLGKEPSVERLTGSLQVDISHTKATLDWKPPYTVDEGLKSCF